MPTSGSIPDSVFRAMQERQQALNNSRRLRSQNEYTEMILGRSSPFGSGILWDDEPSRKDRLSSLRKQNKKEVDDLERFMKTGSGQPYVIYGNDQEVFMIGEDRKPTHILFVMNKKTITANKKRSKHLKELLERFAEQEKRTMVWIDEVPTTTAGPPHETVVFYAFKGMGDVDDTELVSKTKTRHVPLPYVNLAGGTEEAMEDHDHCCEDCCEVCDDDEDGEVESMDWDD